jgi:hypothetical protein
MQIQEALGDIGLPEIASEAPTLTADDVLAAYVYEAERPPTGGAGRRRFLLDPFDRGAQVGSHEPR